MIIIRENFEAKNKCEHCGNKTIHFYLHKYSDRYELELEKECLSYDDYYTLWTGNSLNDLLKILENDDIDLIESDKDIFMGKILLYMWRNDNKKLDSEDEHSFGEYD